MMKKEKFEERTGWSLWVVAAAMVLFGLALLFWPGLTRDMIINIAGSVLMAIGIVNIVKYFLHKSPYRAYDWDLCMGLCCLTAGVLMVVFHSFLLDLVFVAIGMLMLAGGIAKIQLAFNLRRVLYGRWFVALIAAVCSCVLGALIIARPQAVQNILTRFVGASIVVETVMDLVASLRYHRIITTYFED